MKAHRAAMVLAGGVIMAAGSAGYGQASGQAPDANVLNILRECARVDDPTARLACYDNNIRAGGFDGRRPSVPGQGGNVNGGGAPNTSAGGAYGSQGFGAASVKTPERFKSYEDRGEGPDSITAKISSVKEREPGIYLVTLEGGAEWVYTESQAGSRAPRVGDSADISHAALGSFLMRVEGQQAVRVRRVK